LGCFFLRRGAIENYYGAIEEIGTGKPDRAALEAAGFDAKTQKELAMCYNDIYVALNHTAPNQFVDEDRLLRMKLGAM
ncbi:ATP-dependent endonuclease, partial [Escherichia coli]|nr:ATP-dependent endonuclease [Escherichia coli]